ncbi:unnamed protein product [Closterium sp. NIES-65]|nr:unnamed protein product [Closterium sp. NIES-65]
MENSRRGLAELLAPSPIQSAPLLEIITLEEFDCGVKDRHGPEAVSAQHSAEIQADFQAAVDFILRGDVDGGTDGKGARSTAEEAAGRLEEEAGLVIRQGRDALDESGDVVMSDRNTEETYTEDTLLMPPSSERWTRGGCLGLNRISDFLDLQMAKISKSRAHRRQDLGGTSNRSSRVGNTITNPAAEGLIGRLGPPIVYMLRSSFSGEIKVEGGGPWGPAERAGGRAEGEAEGGGVGSSRGRGIADAAVALRSIWAEEDMEGVEIEGIEWAGAGGGAGGEAGGGGGGGGGVGWEGLLLESLGRAGAAAAGGGSGRGAAGGRSRGRGRAREDLGGGLILESLSSFSSARANVCVYSGRWQYEATLGSSGIQQIGWATLACPFTAEEGVGTRPTRMLLMGRECGSGVGGPRSMGSRGRLMILPPSLPFQTCPLGPDDEVLLAKLLCERLGPLLLAGGARMEVQRQMGRRAGDGKVGGGVGEGVGSVRGGYAVWTSLLPLLFQLAPREGLVTGSAAVTVPNLAGAGKEAVSGSGKPPEVWQEGRDPYPYLSLASHLAKRNELLSAWWAADGFSSNLEAFLTRRVATRVDLQRLFPSLWWAGCKEDDCSEAALEESKKALVKAMSGGWWDVDPGNSRRQRELGRGSQGVGGSGGVGGLGAGVERGERGEGLGEARGEGSGREGEAEGMDVDLHVGETEREHTRGGEAERRAWAEEEEEEEREEGEGEEEEDESEEVSMLPWARAPSGATRSKWRERQEVSSALGSSSSSSSADTADTNAAIPAGGYLQRHGRWKFPVAFFLHPDLHYFDLPRLGGLFSHVAKTFPLSALQDFASVAWSDDDVDDDHWAAGEEGEGEAGGGTEERRREERGTGGGGTGEGGGAGGGRRAEGVQEREMGGGRSEGDGEREGEERVEEKAERGKGEEDEREVLLLDMAVLLSHLRGAGAFKQAALQQQGMVQAVAQLEDADRQIAAAMGGRTEGAAAMGGRTEGAGTDGEAGTVAATGSGSVAGAGAGTGAGAGARAGGGGAGAGAAAGVRRVAGEEEGAVVGAAGTGAAVGAEAPAVTATVGLVGAPGGGTAAAEARGGTSGGGTSRVGVGGSVRAQQLREARQVFREDVDESVRLAVWWRVVLGGATWKQRALVGVSRRVGSLLLAASKRGHIFAYEPEVYLEAMRSFLLTRFSDARIPNPDTRDQLLQTLSVLLQLPPFSVALETNKAACTCFMPSLLNAFDQRFWIPVSQVFPQVSLPLRRVLSPSFPSLSLSSSSSTPSLFAPLFQHSLHQLYLHHPSLFSPFFNRLFNTLNWTLTEFLVALKEVQDLQQQEEQRWRRNRRQQQQQQQQQQAWELQQRKCSVMFDLTCNLARLLEVLCEASPEVFLSLKGGGGQEKGEKALEGGEAGGAAAAAEEEEREEKEEVKERCKEFQEEKRGAGPGVLQDHVSPSDQSSRPMVLAPLVGIIGGLFSHAQRANGSAPAGMVRSVLQADPSLDCLAGLEYLLGLDWVSEKEGSAEGERD